MRHQRIILELATEQEIERERQRAIRSRRKRRSLADRQPIPVQNTQLSPPRRRKRIRRDRWRKPLVLISTFILSLLLCRWLLSRQFQSSQVSTSQPQPAPVVSPVDALSRAIISQESTDNYKSLNPHSQALGLAQVMPANISAWSKEALGYRISVNEFYNNPAAQKQIINYKLEQYWQDALAESYGDEELAVLRVASHWYSGSPDLYKSEDTQWYRGKDGKLHRYPSISAYSKSILHKYKQHVREASDW